MGRGRGIAIALGAGTALWLVPVAHAATICVQDPACSGEQAATVGAGIALAANGAHPGRDRVQLGPQTFTEATFVIGAGNAVDLVGAGAGRTELRRPAGGGVTTLRIDEPTAVASDLDVRLASGSNNTGLELYGTTQNVRVLADSAPGGTGVQMFGGEFSGVIALPTGDATVGVTSGGSGLIDGAVITASTGVREITRVRRATITASTGITRSTALGTAMTIDDVVVTVLPGASTAISSPAALSGAPLYPITVRHVTLVGTGDSASTGIAVSANQDESTAALVTGAVIRGFGTDLRRTVTSPPGTASAALTIGYSDFGFARKVSSGGGSGIILVGGGNLDDVDPRFVGPSDFRLRFDSPLLDVRSPAAPASDEPASDRLFLPRVVNGRGDGAPARNDIGAYEYQRKAPGVAASVAAQTGIGQAVTFTASASDPDGDTLGLATWAFDDGATATGLSPAHAFTTLGPHTGTVTVTDATGLSATSTATVNVVAAPVPPVPPVLPGPSAQAASLTAFKASNTTFAVAALKSTKKKRAAPKRGTTLSYTLDRAAAVTIAIARVASGRVSGKSCVAPTRRNRKAKKCTRYVALTTLRQSGKAGRNSLPWTGRYGTKNKAAAPGSYRATASARSGGLTSKPGTLTLKIVKP